MSLFKKDTEQRENIEPALPTVRNFKFKHIKFYSIPESLADEKKYYRRIMEQEEITYLY